MRFPLPPAVTVGPSLFTAIQDQLDLKLVTKRGRWRLW
jgi:hypothetical protein